jgi:hypothetical protein
MKLNITFFRDSNSEFKSFDYLNTINESIHNDEKLIYINLYFRKKIEMQ